MGGCMGGWMYGVDDEYIGEEKCYYQIALLCPPLLSLYQQLADRDSREARNYRERHGQEPEDRAQKRHAHVGITTA
jgi:hypothetical protein